MISSDKRNKDVFCFAQFHFIALKERISTLQFMSYNTYVVVMECRSLFTILLSSQEEYAFVLYVANKITSKCCGTQSTSRTAALKSLLHLFLRGAHPIFLGAQYAIRVVCVDGI
ncbi:hypothetical protein HMPREF3232_01404 [Fannyhessea vaginae]|nr:hypothetical protein HMPREF3232_01404 [Fannyhessea vaginae]